MSTLDYIINKFKLDILPVTKMPVEIPNFGRNELALLLRELNFNYGVEVGVAAGAYSEILCKANPQMVISGVDSWAPYPGYRDYVRQSTLDGLYKKASLLPGKYPNYQIIKEFSIDAVKRFADKSLDFVYLDANHKDPFVTQDITEWHKKVKVGGILAGHDYVQTNHGFDVKKAVQTFAKNNNINTWFILGLEAKIPGMIRDDSRSWMWIKQ